MYTGRADIITSAQLMKPFLEYLEKSPGELIPERLNTVYAAEQEIVEPALAFAQFKVLKNERWD